MPMVVYGGFRGLFFLVSEHTWPPSVRAGGRVSVGPVLGGAAPSRGVRSRRARPPPGGTGFPGFGALGFGRAFRGARADFRCRWERLRACPRPRAWGPRA